MTDHDKLEELPRIKARARVRYRVIVASDACTETSLEMHDPALYAFAYAFDHDRQSKEIVMMMAASKEDA